jgi:hypothetical protein
LALGGDRLDGIDDGLVAGAAAIVAGDEFADLSAVGRGLRCKSSAAVISIPGEQNPH